MPKSPPKLGSSTSSWRIPQPTDILSYVYLWSEEAAAGKDEGSKERPVVVVLAVEQVKDRLEVLVAPITTKPPRQTGTHFELSKAAIRHLGLSAERCWVVTTELNQFRWPGPDIRPVRGHGENAPYYGKLPASQFLGVREMIVDAKGSKTAKIVPRS